MEYNFAKEKRKTVAIVILVFLVILCVAVNFGLVCALLERSSDDDGKIGVNVTTGECKIDVIDSEEKTLVGDVLDFVSADEKNEIYFEPGATYRTESFNVKNIGNIPVNFHVYISEDETNGRQELQEAFELWIAKDSPNPESPEKLTEFTGSLNAGQKSETFYLIIKMKEEAGNEFQNKTYTGIGITVYAVQTNTSFGKEQ